MARGLVGLFMVLPPGHLDKGSAILLWAVQALALHTDWFHCVRLSVSSFRLGRRFDQRGCPAPRGSMSSDRSALAQRARSALDGGGPASASWREGAAQFLCPSASLG